MSLKARRWSVQTDTPLALSDLDGTPAWAEGAVEDRDRLARLTGAVLVSRAWGRAIDGAVLGRAAAALGDEALDALINLPPVLAPSLNDRDAERGDAGALGRLGAGALLTAASRAVAVQNRLSHLFPDGAMMDVDAGAAATAWRTAEGVAREVARGGVGA